MITSKRNCSAGETRILVPDNTRTAVIHTHDWYAQELNTIYHEMAEQYNTAIIPARMRAPKDEPLTNWQNGNKFRNWAQRIGTNTYKVVNVILASQRVEQQSYRSCIGLLKLADKYSAQRLEATCQKALSYTASPSFKSIKNILAAGRIRMLRSLRLLIL